jgi:hypothetical protein
MATYDTSRVSALSHEAKKLEIKGHHFAAAEMYAAAVAAAQALRAEDCLIVACLQQEQADALVHHLLDPAVSGAEACEAPMQMDAMVISYRRKQPTCYRWWRTVAQRQTVNRRSAGGTRSAHHP